MWTEEVSVLFLLWVAVLVALTTEGEACFARATTRVSGCMAGRRAGEQRGQDEAESAVGVRVHGSLLCCGAVTP